MSVNDELRIAMKSSTAISVSAVRRAKTRVLVSWLESALKREWRSATAGKPAPRYVGLTLDRIRAEIVSRADA